MNDCAGDITPQEAWDLLVQNPNAVLVDVRTEAEWRFVGGPRGGQRRARRVPVSLGPAQHRRRHRRDCRRPRSRVQRT